MSTPEIPIKAVEIQKSMGRLLMINGKHVTLYQLNNGSFGAYLREYLSALTGIDEPQYLTKVYNTIIETRIVEYVTFLYRSHNQNNQKTQLVVAEDGFYRIMMDLHRRLGCDPPDKTIDMYSTTVKELYSRNQAHQTLQHETIEGFLYLLDKLQTDISQKCHEKEWPQTAVITLKSRLHYLRVIGQVHNLTTINERNCAAVNAFLKNTHPRYSQ